MNDLNELLDFVKFTHEIRSIKRAILLEDQVYENDSEHMYQLALTSWFLIENDGLKLDKYRVVGMALTQDATEVYSGDTNAHASKAERAEHERREKLANAQLKKKWPSFSSLHDFVDEYQQHKTPESKFVYALDKLMPILNIYLYEGKSWIEQGIDFEEMKLVKIGKIDQSADVNKYYLQLLKILEKKPELFGKRNS